MKGTLKSYNCERERERERERDHRERERGLETESELDNNISVFWHVQLRELRVEDSVGVQENTQGVFGLVKSSRIRVKNGESR